jgi:hypothetical protein
MTKLKNLLVIIQVVLLLIGAIDMLINIGGDADLFNRGLLYIIMSTQTGTTAMLMGKETT